MSDDRATPHSRDAERCLLGSMLRDNAVIGDVVQVVRQDNFYFDAHQKIFEGVWKLYDRATPVDLVTLAEWLREQKYVEDIGGYPYLAELWESAPTGANAEYYARIVREKAIVRNLIHAGNEILRDAYDQSQPADELLGDAERKILEVAELGITGNTTTLLDAIKEAYDRIDARAQNNYSEAGLPTGYVDIDELTAGLHNSELIILAARPSVGKCLAHDAEIVLSDGTPATIAEVYRRQQSRLLTLGGDWQFRWTEPSHFVDDGVKPVYRVTTRLGRRVETTLSHPFLTVRGWRPLAELSAGERVAVPRRLDVFGTEAMRDCEVKLLAYLIGDGTLTGGRPRFTNADERLRAEFNAAAAEFGQFDDRPSDPVPAAPALAGASPGGAAVNSQGWSAAPPLAADPDWDEAPEGRSSRATAGFGRPSGADARIRTIDPGVSPLAIHGRRSAAEAEPHGRPALARWLSRQVLRGTAARDAFIPPPVFRLPRPQLALFLDRLFAAGGGPPGRFATPSERLARQVQHLLLRFGVIAALRRAVPDDGARGRCWQLDVTDTQSIRTFQGEVNRTGESAAAGGAAPDRLADSALYWDEIVSVEPAGEKQVYDLTIPETHNFVANDVCVHNTAMALNIVRNVAVGDPVRGVPPVGVFFVSLEQARVELAERLLCAQARVDSHKLRKGHLGSDDMDKLMKAGDVLSRARLFIDDTPAQGMLRIAANARRLKKRHDIKLVVIDYLQLIDPDNKRDSRQEQVAQISRRLKFLARELKVPVLALAQVNRSSEDRQDHRPRLADLRESGSLEQDADTVFLLHRPGKYDGGGDDNVIEVLIAKQRNGPTGDVTLAYLKQYMRYENYAVGGPLGDI